MQKTNRKSKLSDQIISMILISAFCMIGFAFFVDIAVVTLFLFLNMVLSMLAFLLQIRYKRPYIQYSILLIILIILHFCFYYEDIKLVDSLIFVSVVCFITVVANNQLTETNQKILFWGSVFCAGLLIVNMNNAQYYSEKGWLQFVYVNSNTAGTVALNLLVCILLTMNQCKKVWMKLIATATLVGTVYVIFLTSSRGCFTMAILAIVIYVFRQRKIYKTWLLKVAMVVPIFIIPIMILYYDIVPKNILYLGKEIMSGREILWKEAVITIINNLINAENEFTSGLNVALRMPYLCGLLGTIIFFVFLYKVLFYLNKTTMTDEKVNLALLIFSCLWMQQSFESTIISGSYSICFLSYAILGLAKVKGENI